MKPSTPSSNDRVQEPLQEPQSLRSGPGSPDKLDNPDPGFPDSPDNLDNPDPGFPDSPIESPIASRTSARRVALTGLLAALALIFSYVEFLVPFNAGVPGIKLGLANLVPLIILYRLDARYAFAANLVRVILAGLLFSGMFAALYSLAGSVTSFLVMFLLKKTDLFSVIGVSTAGGVFHNLGQLCVAIIAVSGPQLIHYMPVLIISGMAAGIIVGIGAAILLDRIPVKLFRA